MTGIEGLTMPWISVLLAVTGVVAMFLAAWIHAVDIAVARISVAYAEDLEEEGRRGATALRMSVASRKGASLALTVPRGASQTVGIVFLSAVLLGWFDRLGWPGWLMLLGTLLIIGVVWWATVLFLSMLLRGNRYVAVALAGAAMGNRLIGNTGVMAAKSRLSRRRPAESREEMHTRLELADDLRELADEVSEGSPEALEEEDREILRSVLELGQTRVGEVMVPRGQMVTISGEETARAAVNLFVQSGFSRIPVVGRNVDDMLGVLYFKDVVRRLQESAEAGDCRVVDLMRTASFVPEMKLADDELRVMQSTNSHLALVVDEYGGIAGLVTIEDILEELVGELMDEHDHPTQQPEEVETGVWLVPSSLSLDDLSDLIEFKVDDDDVYSVGGLLAKGLGKVPLPGASTTIEGLELTASNQVGRRRQVLSVLVSKSPTTEQPRTFATQANENEQAERDSND